jgi:cell division protein FtsQ
MKSLNRPAKIMLILLSAVVLTVLVIVANVARSRSQVRGIEVAIRYDGIPHLVSDQTVVDTVLRRMPNLMQLSVKNVDCKRVASAARRVPFLTRVSSSVSVGGKVVVRAEQRRPIARLYYGNREFYIDCEGVLFPPSPIGHCDVLVAGGDFTEPLRLDSLNAQAKALWKLACFLDEKKKYSTLIDQIYIERNGDMMMVPKVGDHVIELGTIDDLDNKFSNLLTFYLNGMPRAGWNTYSKISLKFKGQVVCTKK